MWGACGEDHEDQEKAAAGAEGWIVLGSVQPTSQSGERCLEGRPHPPERHGSALPTLPCAPRHHETSMLMDSCGGKTVKVRDQIRVIFC